MAKPDGPAEPRWHRTVVSVDRDAIGHNVRQLSPPGVPVMAMVKGDAYGHGAIEAAATAVAAGARWLGVALVQEGLRLRQAGFAVPIFVSTELPAGSEVDAVRADLRISVHTDDGLLRLADAARALDRPVGAHLAVDTGLARAGVAGHDAVGFAGRLARAGLRLDGVWTHLAKSEDIDSFTARQLDRFDEVLAGLHAGGHRPVLRHAANTAAVLAWPRSHLDLVRPGIGLFGAILNAGLSGADALRPALTWRSRVVQTSRLRAGQGVSYGLTYRVAGPATVATVAVGFADGYPRQLSNRGEVLIRGRRYPVAGVIAMDQLTVDVGDDPVAPGDEVVLIGRQGEQSITVAEVADWAGTIPDEVFCGISARVPRDYVGSPPPAEVFKTHQLGVSRS
ncbi:alanine racemase [Actinocrispum wychmicini]|uniref:Alanine racemase n=1 Tax=Actinocrispum wychmicini TaxID=1213861 RepID=A0A4R2K2J5_9PSEU|nr:alanine racemase [Actinocrispum wychmicini]TCO65937.1 alanine racemase [Actinocrispum wychmicini]